MRWRNCGVSTSLWERLVVSLRDIPQIRLPLLLRLLLDFAALAAREDYNRSEGFSVQSLCTLWLKLKFAITYETFRRDKGAELPSLPLSRAAGQNERFYLPP